MQEILYEIGYQLGVPRLLRFKKTLEHIKENEYLLASSEMLDSKWAKQTPARANRLAERMREV